MDASLEGVTAPEVVEVVGVKFFKVRGKYCVSAVASAVLILCVGCSSSRESATEGKTEPASARILYFYAGQAAVPPGEPAQICYGVENATSLRLEPGLTDVRPLSSKCVWIEAKQTTDLTLVAVGEDGKEVRASATVTVRAGAPSSTRTEETAAGTPSSSIIETFAATASKVPSGGMSTICYVISKPASLSLEPAQGDLGSELKKCVIVKPTTTTTYTLTANADGKTETAKVTVRVE